MFLSPSQLHSRLCQILLTVALLPLYVFALADSRADAITRPSLVLPLNITHSIYPVSDPYDLEPYKSGQILEFYDYQGPLPAEDVNRVIDLAQRFGVRHPGEEPIDKRELRYTVGKVQLLLYPEEEMTWSDWYRVLLGVKIYVGYGRQTKVVLAIEAKGSLVQIIGDRVFAHALNTVKRIPRTGSARPPPADRLKLYGLYKQSMEGDVEGVMRRPPDDAPDTEETRTEREKWDAWHHNAGLSRTAAKRAYISTLIATMHAYASSTAEARELVAELEFVWDQIKANSNVSSSESSPRGPVERSKLGMSYASLGGERRRVRREDEGGGGGLRVLRPVSDGDEEEEDGYVDNEEDLEMMDEDGERYPDPTADPAAGGNKSRDLDIRNRKWRKRIETALFKMSTEVAALREQIEAKRIGGRNMYGKENGVWAWIRWLVWVAMRQLLVDAVVVGLVFLWARKKNDERIEQGLWLVMQAVKEQLREIRGLWIRRVRGVR
ncbi:MAG: hypothetical protein Q9225_004893 [Loekoesia sp. 1 TL-2023]